VRHGSRYGAPIAASASGEVSTFEVPAFVETSTLPRKVDTIAPAEGASRSSLFAYVGTARAHILRDTNGDSMNGNGTPGEVGLAVAVPLRNDAELLRSNRRFYDPLWADTRLVKPESFNTWPLVQSLLPQSARRLEIAPGLRPRLPMAGTQFVDISAPALEKLRQHGARVILSSVTRLPFADAAFDLVLRAGYHRACRR
jgi:hypothetical protein